MPGRGGGHPNKETLSAYADRGLSAAERGRVARHLEQCAACSAQLAQVRADLRTTSDFFQRIPAQRPPAELRRSVWRGVEAIDERRRRARWLLGAQALGVAVVAMLLFTMAPQVITLLSAFSLPRHQDDRLAAPTATEFPLAVPPLTDPPPPTEVPSTVVTSPSGAAVSTSTVAAATATTVATAATATTLTTVTTAATATVSGAAATATAPAKPSASAGAAATIPSAGPAGSASSPASPPAAPPAASATPALQYRVVAGQIAAVNRSQRTMGVADASTKTWQFGISEGTLFLRKDGQRLGFEDIGLGDQVEVTGFQSQAATSTGGTGTSALGTTLMASQVKVLTSVAQARQAPHVLVLLDGAAALHAPQYGYTGDWIKRLGDTGYAVTALDPSRVTSTASLKDFALVVIGYPATLSDAALQAIKGSKLPVLVGDPRLVQPLGLGQNQDPAQPVRMVPGRSVDIPPQAGLVTRGYGGDTEVANDTLYRTPIVTNGTVLGTIPDSGRKLTVWSVTGSTMYFGFWWSNTGQNHNATYWTLFDRSVLFLLGKDPSGPTPGPTPVPGR